jgi:ribosomal 30S subunit maturation factor RimM
VAALHLHTLILLSNHALLSALPPQLHVAPIRPTHVSVCFAPCCNRTSALQASTLANFTLLLALCDRERLADADEFFVQDLIGMKAYLQGSNQLIGAVTEVYDGTGTYDTLRLRLVPTAADIRGSQYRTVLVPFVEAIVPVVDKRGRRLELTPPEGLLDPAVITTTKLRKPYSPQQQEQLLQQLAKQQEQQQQALAEKARQPAAAAGSSTGGDDEEDEEDEDEEEVQQTQQQASYRQRQLALRQRRLQQRRAAMAKKKS